MRKMILLCAVAAGLMFCGCSSPQMEIGKYQITDSGREDVIMVYENMLIMQIKSPENSSGSLKYWNWGGKYTLDENGEIFFDMDRETMKRWRFYYSFLKRRNGIVLNDLSTNKGYLLKYQIPKKRPGTQPGYIPTGSTGVDHNYTTLTEQE